MATVSDERLHVLLTMIGSRPVAAYDRGRCRA
jgi:hypothetical protein